MHPDPRAQTVAENPNAASEPAAKDAGATAGTIAESEDAAATLAEPKLKMGRRRDLLKDLVGRVLKSQYRIESLLGQGAMGVVFRGVQLGLDKPVAIKMMRPDVFHSADSLDRFQREAQLVSKVIHPSIAQVLDYGVDDDIPFVVMEFVDGKELTEVMAIEGPMPPARAVAIVRQLASAIDEAHKHGIVHRDLKPQNLRLMRYQKGGQIFLKVLDFGVAKQVGDGSASAVEQGKLTATGAVIGTPMYMAPEQAGGQKVDARADQYAAGIVLYELLTGTVPFTGETLTGVLVSHLTKPPPPLPRQVPEALQRIVLRLLAKKPADRFPSMAALDQALAEAEAACRDVPSLVPGKVQPLVAGGTDSAREWRRTAALGGGALLLAGAVLVLVIALGPRLRHHADKGPGSKPVVGTVASPQPATPAVTQPGSPTAPEQPPKVAAPEPPKVTTPEPPKVTAPPPKPTPPVAKALAAPPPAAKETPEAKEKLDEAEQQIKDGDFRRAIDLARQSLTSAATARAHRLIAAGYCHMGDLGNAKAAFHKVAVADRRSVVALCKKNDIDLP